MRAIDSSGDRLEALRYQARLLPDPTEFPAFRRHMVCRPADSLRLNPLASQAELLRPVLQRSAEPVTWCPDAFVLSEPRPRLGHCLEYALGAVYIQAKATTLAVEALAPQPGERVLDLAAAPGGKATHVAGLMRNSGLLVANEPARRRLNALIGNLERCGVHNAIATRASGTLLARWFHNFFDRVLLDAPCSGDGIVCKDQTVLAYWSVEDARRKGSEQTGLLRAAFHMLRPGGTLVYSTCSLATEENEDVLLGLTRRYRDQVELQPVSRVETSPLPADVASCYPDQFRHVVRIWPHRHQTEGATVALLAKRGVTRWDRLHEDVSAWLEDFEADSGEEARALWREMESHWDFRAAIPRDQEVYAARRYLAIRPQVSAAFEERLPHFVRAGMRAASLHKGHGYLTHQAVMLWGRDFLERCLEVTWPQVQSLFRGDSIQVPGSSVPPGDVVCTFGPWAVCRAQMDADGATVRGYVPKALRCPEIQRLTDV